MDERKRGHEAGGPGGQPEATPAPDPEAVRRARLARFDPAGAKNAFFENAFFGNAFFENAFFENAFSSAVGRRAASDRRLAAFLLTSSWLPASSL